MDFIDGVSLGQRLAAGPLPGRAAARYVEAIARAIHHAHQHGILHRDLKPSNILLDRARQAARHRLRPGQAAARRQPAQTRTGAVLGTPGYMAPEQAGGRIKELAAAADVYGLGAVLYECLTGRPPFQAETPLDTLMQVLEHDRPRPACSTPRRSRPGNHLPEVPRKGPGQPLPEREALADDLRRFLDGESISASTVNVFEYLGRTLGRSQYMGEFRTWGNMLLLFAAIIAVEHLVIFSLIEARAGRSSSCWCGRCNSR